MKASHKTNRAHIKVGKDDEEEDWLYQEYNLYNCVINAMQPTKACQDTQKKEMAGQTENQMMWTMQVL